VPILDELKGDEFRLFGRKTKNSPPEENWMKDERGSDAEMRVEKKSLFGGRGGIEYRAGSSQGAAPGSRWEARPPTSTAGSPIFQRPWTTANYSVGGT
jgi:hypothetical protein